MRPVRKKYQAALYMRLSKDDEGTGESASISTQRKMLRAYCAENGYDVYDEYVDDGWSGTNFDRPDWQRLIKDIESKKINLVVTKDLSRLGRDYIATGQYTEIYFPSKGVRYIAINDGYDSDSPYTDIAPFKNIINEMYARDTSKKIRSAFQTKMREGAFIGNFAPYGYRKDPDNKNHLVVDYAVAPIVQQIFNMAENGYPPSEIARQLNSKGIMTPAMYRCSKRPYLSAEKYSQRKEWTSSTICKMLRNIVYLGHVAQGKTTKVSFKSQITLQNGKNEWIVVKDMHEPLITQETFDKVRGRCVSRRSLPKSSFTNVFSGIAKCADCGRNMSSSGSRKKGSVYNLVCGGYKLYGSVECTNHFIDYDVLYDVVVQDLRDLLSLTDGDKEKILESIQKVSGAEENDGQVTVMKKLQKREGEVDQIIERLYEDRITGRLDEKQFDKMFNKYQTEQKDITARLESLTRSAVLREKQTAEEAYRLSYLLLEEVTEVKTLTPKLLKKLVDRIEVCQGSFDCGKRGPKHQTIRIYYRFVGRIGNSIDFR